MFFFSLTVGVFARVGHGEEAGPVVLERERLVLELIAVDARAAGAVGLLEVASLDDEARYDAVEERVAVAEAVQVGAESAEVLGRLGHDAAEELDADAADVLLLDGDVHEDARMVESQQLGKHELGARTGLDDLVDLVVELDVLVVHDALSRRSLCRRLGPRQLGCRRVIATATATHYVERGKFKCTGNVLSLLDRF